MNRGQFKNLISQSFSSELEPDWRRMITAVLEEGIHPDTQDENGRTFLMLAASRNNITAIRGLVGISDADTNIKDHNGRKAYDYATSDEARHTLAYNLNNEPDTTFTLRGAATNLCSALSSLNK